jgi:hypothetical protein
MRRRQVLGAAAAALAGLAGCASNAPPTHWYALRSEPPVAEGQVQVDAPQRPARAGAAVWEMSGTVRLPGSLDRDTLQLRSGQAGLQPLAGHRWAEPLRDSVPRLLLQDLARLRGSASVWAAPAPPGVAVTQRLVVELLALQADTGGRHLHMHARWWLLDLRSTAPGTPAVLTAPLPGEAAFDIPLADTTVDSLAAAHRLALWRLAERIAAPGMPAPS